jgi:N-terminal domain of (some) glycogen debranching enzymes
VASRAPGSKLLIFSMVEDGYTRMDAMREYYSTATTGNDRSVTGNTTPETQAGGSLHHILAASSLADERTRVLKHGDTFADFDHYGDMKSGGLGEAGLYHEGTRYLCCLLLELEGGGPFFLGSSVRDENDQLAVTLTNPDLLRDGQVRLPLGTLHLAVKKFLWRGTCYQQLRVKNHGLEPVETSLLLHFKADYADLFEVSGRKRQARGQDLTPEVTDDHVVLGYRGLDGVVRHTLLQFTPRPSRLTASSARLDLVLGPQQEAMFSVMIACQGGPSAPLVLPFHRHRRPRARPAGGADSPGPRVILRLGCPNARHLRKLLQPDGLPHRLRLAARQRPDCARPDSLRPGRAGCANMDGAVRGRPVLRPPPYAGAVLRVPKGPWGGSDPLPRGLCAASAGSRSGLSPLPGLPQPGD